LGWTDYLGAKKKGEHKKKAGGDQGSVEHASSREGKGGGQKKTWLTRQGEITRPKRQTLTTRVQLGEDMGEDNIVKGKSETGALGTSHGANKKFDGLRKIGKKIYDAKTLSQRRKGTRGFGARRKSALNREGETHEPKRSQRGAKVREKKGKTRNTRVRARKNPACWSQYLGTCPERGSGERGASTHRTAQKGGRAPTPRTEGEGERQTGRRGGVAQKLRPGNVPFGRRSTEALPLRG